MRCGRVQRGGCHLSDHATRADHQHALGIRIHSKRAGSFNPSFKLCPSLIWVLDLVALPRQMHAADRVRRKGAGDAAAVDVRHDGAAPQVQGVGEAVELRWPKLP